MNTDQWKLDGICAQCRRVKYCGATCTAHKRHIEKIKEQAFKDVMKEKYPELAKIIENNGKE